MDGDFFDDLDRLRLDQQHPRQTTAKGTGSKIFPKPQRMKGEFLKGPIPLAWLSSAARLPGKSPLGVALAVMFEVGRKRTQEVILTNAVVARFGLNRKSKYRGIAALEKAGLIAVRRRPHKNPVVKVLEIDDDQNAAGNAQDGPEAGTAAKIIHKKT
jgi:hypothetical protein